MAFRSRTVSAWSISILSNCLGRRRGRGPQGGTPLKHNKKEADGAARAGASPRYPPRFPRGPRSVPRKPLAMWAPARRSSNRSISRGPYGRADVPCGKLPR